MREVKHWIRCADCRSKIEPGSPRIVVNGRTICADCAYAAQMGVTKVRV